MKALSGPSERDRRPYHEISAAMPLLRYVFQGIANYRCYTSSDPPTRSYRSSGSLQWRWYRILFGSLRGIVP